MNLDSMHAKQVEMLRVLTSLCHEHGLSYYVLAGTLLGAVRHKGFIPWDDDVDIGMPRQDYDRLLEISAMELPSRYEIVDWQKDSRMPIAFAKLIDRRTILVEPGWRQPHQVELGLFLDIFPLDGVPNGRIRKWSHFAQIYLLRKLLMANAIEKNREKKRSRRGIVALVQFLIGGNGRTVGWLHQKLDRRLRRYAVDSSEQVCNYLGGHAAAEMIPIDWIGNGAWLDFEGLAVRAFERYDAYLRRVYGDYWKLPPPHKRRSHHSFIVSETMGHGPAR